MGKLLQRTDLRWRVGTLPKAWGYRIIGVALVAIAAPLVFLTLLGNRPGQSVADPRESMGAEIARLEGQISSDAADVASLRTMAEQARVELATLRSQKGGTATASDSSPALPGADRPFYSPPLHTPGPSVREVIVNDSRNLHPRTARDYLFAAHQYVASGRPLDAQTALERAETRALNDSTWRDQDFRHSQLIRQIGDARHLLAGGEGARTAQAIDAAARSAR